MKILILGDTHGHDTWKRILEKENPDRVIFLGDYFDSFTISPQVQADNFKEIISTQETMGNDKMILLLGNHDYHYFVNGCNYSGYQYRTKVLAKPLLDSAVSKGSLKIIHIEDNTIFSHAGISQYWFENVSGADKLEDITFEKLNLTTLDWNGIMGYNAYGDTISNSPLWIRPNSLIKDHIGEYNQVVGHTTTKRVELLPVFASHIYICDSLPYEYLTIEDGEFKIKKVTE